MLVRDFLIIVYGLAGLLIASITAFMTFLIIEEPIGYKMGSKIVIVILLTTPIIVFISVVIGRMFAKHIHLISSRLEKILDGEYNEKASISMIKEFTTINHVSNKMANEIHELLTSLKNKNEELTMMLLTLSHDIKTPLTISTGYIEELEDNMVSHERLPLVYSKLKIENNYINELCNDILSFEYSKNQIARENEIVFIQPLADEVINLLDTSITNKLSPSFTLEFNVIDLKKILMNLFQNALKYAQSQEIIIYNLHKKIIVEDSGIGIESQYLSKIFNPFYTIDSSKNREMNGFGLGLAITKNLCNRNKFCIEYDVSYTKGARFILFEKDNA